MLPRPVSGQDAEELLRRVSELEAGLIGDSGGRPELRLALANLNLRLRYALGEHDEAPEPDTGVVDHDVAFGSVDEAARFCDA